MTLAQPAWLALILLGPLLAIAAVVASRLRARQWSAFVSDRLRPRLLQRSSPVPRWISLACLIAALVMLSIALSRPQARRGTDNEEILGRNIILTLDLSRSMNVADVKPNRLTQAKALSYELLEALPRDLVGLVGFAGTPYLFAPLTVDHAAVREIIDQIDTDWIPTGGSNLAGGLELAIETLKSTGTKQNAIILMTDGEEHEGRIAELAQEAQESGIEIITIGFGTPEGDFVPDRDNPRRPMRDRQGIEVISRLEPAPLERLASVTGGRFAIAASGADIPAMVQTAVADLERVRVASRERTIVVEYFQWFLLPAILLLIASVFAGTRWRGVSTPSAVATPSAAKSSSAAALLCLGLLMSASPEASAATLSDARRALAEERFQDAFDAFQTLAEEEPDAERSLRYRLAQGNAAYRKGDWAAARNAFSQALRSSSTEVRQAAHHGLGNTLFETGWARLSGGPAYPETREPEAEKPGVAESFRRIADALLDMFDKEDADTAEAQDESTAEKAEPDPLAPFDEMVRARLLEWMEDPPRDSEPSRSAERFNELLTDWIDAVRHYDAAAGYAPAAHNRELTVKYLQRLRELMEELNENAQNLQILPQAGQGEPDDQQGEGDGEGDPRNGKGGREPREEDGSGEQEGEESEEGAERDEPGVNPGDQTEKNDPADQPKPGETPEEAARRILRENADLQKGALSPGRVRFRQPEKDW